MLTGKRVASTGAAQGIGEAPADHAAKNVRVNCIRPGVIDTELNRPWMAETADFAAAYRDQAVRTPLGRLGGRRCLALMAADTRSFMTGTPILQDGGHTVSGARSA